MQKVIPTDDGGEVHIYPHPVTRTSLQMRFDSCDSVKKLVDIPKTNATIHYKQTRP